MKAKIHDIISAIFSLFIVIAIFGGGLVFAMFIVAIIIGGETGQQIAIVAKDIVMPYFIRSASIGVLAGLISFYISGKHSLSFHKDSN